MSSQVSRIHIVGVMSSARLNGNTATLVREALKGAEEEGAVTTEIALPKHQISFCQGCLRCMAEGRCPAEAVHLSSSPIRNHPDVGRVLGIQLGRRRTRRLEG